MLFHRLPLYRNMHYMDSLTLQLGFNMLLFGSLLIFLSIIFEIILRKYRTHHEEILYVPAPSSELGSIQLGEVQNGQNMSSERSYDIETHNEEKLNKKLTKAIKSKRERVCNVVFYGSKVLLFLGCTLLAFMPSLFSGSGRIPVFLSIVWALSIFSLFLCYLLFSIFSPHNNGSKTTPNSAWKKLLSAFKRNFGICRDIYRHRFPVLFAILAFFSIFIPLATTGLCVTNFSDKYGYYWLEVRRVSSTFTRWFEIEKVCPPGPPCHVYTTVPEDTSTAFFLNVHTHTDVEELIVGYMKRSEYKEGASTQSKKKAQMFPFRGVESLGVRNVHSIYIDNLEEGTEYYLEVEYDGKVQSHHFYKTLPAKHVTTPFTIAMGGDVGSNYTVGEMNREVAKYNPDILVIAGDAGYDDGSASCYYSWDLFFKYFEEMYATVGRLVPFVIGIGNHDIGYNALAYPDITVNEEGPLFYLFLPQHLPQNAKGETEARVPSLTERKPYFYHNIGNTLHLSLDSAYQVPIEGEQTSWIKKVVNKHRDLARFVNYHVPVYPACFKPAVDDDRTPKLVEKYWIPLFEQLKFMTVFENHAHFYKRTKPLLQGKEHPDGIIYLGDGAWGVYPNFCHGNNKPRKYDQNIYEKHDSLNHVWMLIVNQTTVKYEPLGIDGNLIEEPLYKVIPDYALTEAN